MNLNKRLLELEDIAERVNRDYETGAWIIFEHLDGTREINSARVGKHKFQNEAEMQTFIDKHHKGTPPSWGNLDFIRVSYVNPQEEPLKEL